MNGKRRRFNVILSKKAKFLGAILSGGMLGALFSIFLILVATSMNSGILLIVGFFLLGVGMFFTIIGGREYSKEYNNCLSNTRYTTVFKDKKGVVYRVVQNSDSDVLEINYEPVEWKISSSGEGDLAGLIE